MLRITLVVLVATLACRAESDFEATNRLFQSVVVGNFSAAVSQSKSLYNYRKPVLQLAVERLITDGRRNLLDYAYALWNGNAQDVARDIFPVQVRTIIGQHKFKIVGVRDNMVIKYDATADDSGDRLVFGDSNHNIGDRMAWEAKPVPGDQLYFKFYNPHIDQYLMLGDGADSDGDHTVYGTSNNCEHSCHWYLYPVKYKESTLFYVFNRKFPQAIKFSRHTNSYGDRWVYSENGNVFGQPYAFGINIVPITSRFNL